MEELICLDTGILIGILRKHSPTLSWLDNLPPDAKIATTLITMFELYRGAYLSSRKEKELQDIYELSKEITILPFNITHMKEAAQESVDLQKQGNSVDIRDLFIGVITREEGYALKTSNKKHFDNIARLKLAD